MNPLFFIRLPHDASAPVSWLRAGETGAALGNVASGTLEQAATELLGLPGATVVVLVPATEVVFARAAVPGKTRARLLQALPYVLEDQLAEEVEQLHFAAGQRDTDGQLATAVVARTRMDEWHARLSTASIQADFMVSEMQLLPHAAHAWCVLQANGVALLRTGVQQGCATDGQNLGAVVQAALHEAGEARPERLRLIVTAGETPAEGVVAEGVERLVEVHAGHPLLLFARHFDPQTVINLLQGAYSKREQIGRLWRPWRVAAALLAVWLVFEVGVVVFESSRLARAQQQLTTDIEQIYRTSFPGARKVVNARVQMQHQLDALRASAGTGASDFLGLLASASVGLQADPAIALSGISYKERQLEIAVEVPDMQALDQLKQRLTQSQLAVEVQSVAARAGKVEGRLQIRSQS